MIDFKRAASNMLLPATDSFISFTKPRDNISLPETIGDKSVTKIEVLSRMEYKHLHSYVFGNANTYPLSRTDNQRGSYEN
jgi:hypothetical protein